jgi:hypothetical protein
MTCGPKRTLHPTLGESLKPPRNGIAEVLIRPSRKAA